MFYSDSIIKHVSKGWHGIHTKEPEDVGQLSNITTLNVFDKVFGITPKKAFDEIVDEYNRETRPKINFSFRKPTGWINLKNGSRIAVPNLLIDIDQIKNWKGAF